MSQEIETTLDESSVTAGAKPADPQPKLGADGSSLAGVQDLGGPTPQNSKPTDDSNKYKTIAGGNATAPTTKPSDASGSKQDTLSKKPTFDHVEAEGEVIAEEEVEETMIEVDLSADVAALTEGEDLSEEFKDKARTIFEAAVISRLNEEIERLHEDYAKVLEEEIETVKSELAEQVDEYLTYAVSNWMKNNELAIEHGIKAEMSESVLAGIKQVFVENFIDLPDEKVDLVDELQEQLETMEAKLNESIEENIGLHREVGAYIKNGIVTEISEGLSLTQREKLASLAEAVEFENEETFRQKISTLRESYFSTKPEATSLTEDVQVENAPTGDAMSVYVQALSRWGK
jgi:ribosomal protein S13